MASPYNAPLTGSPSFETKEQRELRLWDRVVKWSIIGLIAPIVFGVSGTVIAMTRAYHRLAHNPEAETADFSVAISNSLRTTQIGVCIAIVALVCLVIATSKRRSLTRSQSKAR